VDAVEPSDGFEKHHRARAIDKIDAGTGQKPGNGSLINRRALCVHDSLPFVSAAHDDDRHGRPIQHRVHGGAKEVCCKRTTST
jgi:hypothetical protein